MNEAAPKDMLSLRRDPARGIEVLQARFHGHAYDMHSHDDEWLIGVTHHGIQDFFCRGRRRQSTAGRLILIEPGERHDGRATDPLGFGYSMLYLPRNWLRAELGGDAAIGFRETLTEDRGLAASVLSLCAVVFQGDGRLTIEARRDALSDSLRPHLGAARREPEAASGGIAARALDYLHSHFADDVDSSALVAASGAISRFQLNRAFKSAYGVTPHARLIEIRLARARALLRRSEAPAAVAADCGFADQSHLIRWFRRAYGLPPGAFSRGRTNLQSGPATFS